MSKLEELARKFSEGRLYKQPPITSKLTLGTTHYQLTKMTVEEMLRAYGEMVRQATLGIADEAFRKTTDVYRDGHRTAYEVREAIRDMELP
jgi:hypothetical protein